MPCTTSTWKLSSWRQNRNDFIYYTFDGGSVCVCGYVSVRLLTLWRCRQVHLAYGMMIVWLVHAYECKPTWVPWVAAMAQVQQQHRGNGPCLNDISHTHDAPYLVLLIIFFVFHSIWQKRSFACNAYRKIYYWNPSLNLRGAKNDIEFWSVQFSKSILYTADCKMLFMLHEWECSLFYTQILEIRFPYEYKRNPSVSHAIHNTKQEPNPYKYNNVFNRPISLSADVMIIMVINFFIDELLLFSINKKEINFIHFVLFRFYNSNNN